MRPWWTSRTKVLPPPVLNPPCSLFIYLLNKIVYSPLRCIGIESFPTIPKPIVTSTVKREDRYVTRRLRRAPQRKAGTREVLQLSTHAKDTLQYQIKCLLKYYKLSYNYIYFLNSKFWATFYFLISNCDMFFYLFLKAIFF
jgi:hypothetical protein